MANQFEQMRAFIGVVESGGFSKAVERTGLSRAVLSKNVLDLEARLGTRLMNRTTRRMSLTDSGHTFYEKSRRILDDLEDAERELQDASSTPQGTLRVVSPVNFGLSDLGLSVAEFLRAFPHIKINLSLNDHLIDPVDGGFDIAVRLYQSEPQLPKTISSVLISQSTRILCASPSYLSRNQEPESPNDLTEHDCLCYSYMDNPAVWHLSGEDEDYVVPVSSRITTSAASVLATAAERGLGIAYGPEAFFREQLALGSVRQVLSDYRLPRASIYSLFARSPYVPAKINAFNEFMQRFFVGRIS